MLRLRIDLTLPLAPQLAPAVEAIRAGRVVACPTDTLYALAADPRSDAALAAVFALKGREPDRTVALMAADLVQVHEIVELSAAAERLALRFWPGPLTLVVPARMTLASPVQSNAGLVGMRVPNNRVARALAEECGHALTATSANLSGRPPTADPDEVVEQLPTIDVVVDGGLAPGGPPSTVVEVVGDAARLVREGAIAWERVLKSLDRPS